jgi:hypothetical protein
MAARGEKCRSFDAISSLQPVVFPLSWKVVFFDLWQCSSSGATSADGQMRSVQCFPPDEQHRICNYRWNFPIHFEVCGIYLVIRVLIGKKISTYLTIVIMFDDCCSLVCHMFCKYRSIPLWRQFFTSTRTSTQILNNQHRRREFKINYCLYETKNINFLYIFLPSIMSSSGRRRY